MKQGLIVILLIFILAIGGRINGEEYCKGNGTLNEIGKCECNNEEYTKSYNCRYNEGTECDKIVTKNEPAHTITGMNPTKNGTLINFGKTNYIQYIEETGDVYEYGMITKSWTKLTAPIISLGTVNCNTVFTNPMQIVCYQYDTTTVREYDMVANGWSTFDTATGIPAMREMEMVNVVGGRIYAMGGIADGAVGVPTQYLEKIDGNYDWYNTGSSLDYYKMTGTMYNTTQSIAIGMTNGNGTSPNTNIYYINIETMEYTMEGTVGNVPVIEYQGIAIYNKNTLYMYGINTEMRMRKLSTETKQWSYGPTHATPGILGLKAVIYGEYAVLLTTNIEIDQFQSCECRDGYQGNACDQVYCYGAPQGIEYACSGNGQCIGPNQCQCNATYDIKETCNMVSENTQCEITTKSWIGHGFGGGTATAMGPELFLVTEEKMVTVDFRMGLTIVFDKHIDAPPYYQTIYQPLHFNDHTCQGTTNAIYCFKGLNSFYQLDLTTYQWSSKPTNGTIEYNYPTSFMKDTNTMIIIGSNEVLQMDIVTMIYHIIKDLPFTLSKSSAKPYKTGCLVFGGMQSDQLSNALHYINLEGNDDYAINTTGTIPSPRHTHKTLMHFGSFYVVGGMNIFSTFQSFHVLDLKTKKWRLLNYELQYAENIFAIGNQGYITTYMEYKNNGGSTQISVGSLTLAGSCSCKTGHSGFQCEKNICGNYDSSHRDVCSGHGQCVGVDQCACQEGYKGTNCEQFFNYSIKVVEPSKVCEFMQVDVNTTAYNYPPDSFIFMMEGVYRQIIIPANQTAISRVIYPNLLSYATPLTLIVNVSLPESNTLVLQRSSYVCPAQELGYEDVHVDEYQRIELTKPTLSELSCISMTYTWSYLGNGIDNDTFIIENGLPFQSDSYSVLLTITHPQLDCEYSHVFKIHVKEPMELIPVIKGGSRIVRNQTVELDARSTTLYSKLEHLILYTWSCIPLSANVSCPNLQSVEHQHVTFPFGKFRIGLLARVATIIKSISISLDIKNETVVPITLKATRPFYYGKPNIIRAHVEGDYSMMWHYQFGHQFPIEVNTSVPYIHIPSTNETSLSVVCTLMNANGKVEEKFKYLTSPFGGTVAITPTTGDSTTLFRVNFDRYQSVITNSFLYSISFKHDTMDQYNPLIVKSSESTVPLYLPSGNLTLKMVIHDNQGGYTEVLKTMQVTKGNLNLEDLLNNNETSLETKTSVLLQSTDKIKTIEQVNRTMDILEQLKPTLSNAYIQSKMLDAIKMSNQSNTRYMALLTKTIDTLTNATSNGEQSRDTATNCVYALESRVSKMKTEKVHEQINRLVHHLDQTMYLGDDIFEVNSTQVKLSIAKVQLNSVNNRTYANKVHLPTTLSNEISKLTKIMPTRGVTIILNQFSYVTNKASVSNTTSTNHTLSNMVELSFTNQGQKIPLANMSTPLLINMNKTLDNHLAQQPKDKPYYQATCVYYNTTLSKWAENGCTYKNGTCYCTHTTEFAIDLSLILPQFNLIDFEKHSITKLNEDNMTVTLILCGMLFFYIIAMCFLQLLDMISIMLAKHKVRTQPHMPIGYVDTAGHRHYVIPLFQRLRDVHQWVSVLLSPNTTDRSFTKQQRLTVLYILILGIMMSNALTVGIGAENETIYVTACIVADLLTQPFTMLATFLFLKVKPQMSKDKVETQKLASSIDTLVKEKDTLQLKEMQHQLQVLSSKGEEIAVVTASWRSTSLPLKLSKVYLSSKLANGNMMVFGSFNEYLFKCTYRKDENEWKSEKLDAPELPEMRIHSGKYLYDPEKQRIYFFYASQDESKLKCRILSCTSGTWMVTVPTHHEQLPWCQAGFTIFQSNIYCFGGRHADLSLSNHFMMMDSTSLSWKMIPLTRLSQKPSPRTLPILVANERHIYMMSGYDEKQQPLQDAFVFNSEISGFEYVHAKIPMDPREHHVKILPDQENEVVLCFYNQMNSFNWLEASSATSLGFSTPTDPVYPEDSIHIFDDCLFSTTSQLYFLDNFHFHGQEEDKDEQTKKGLLQQIEMEQYVHYTFNNRLGRDLGIQFMDGLLGKLAHLFRSVDIKKFGVIIIILASLVYFAVIAIGCYMMVFINWLGVIGTTTYGVMGLLGYITLFCQLYIQSKRKVYLTSDHLTYRNRHTYVAVICLLLLSVVLLLSGIGVMFALTNIEKLEDRVGIMLIAAILFIGLIVNALRLVLNLLWAPARQKNKVIALVSSPWFPHFFKYPIYFICWAEIGVMCWILIMYSIKFYEDNMTPDWLIACGFGNSQNFFLDQTLVFITTTFVMGTVLQFFEELIRPQHKIVVLQDEDETDMISVHSEESFSRIGFA